MTPAQHKISIILLSFNSAATIGRTLRSLSTLSDDIHVVDSYSSDDTVEVCRALGCAVTQRAFLNYADQRNWAIDNLSLRHDWQMHVDADEEFTPELITAIERLNLSSEGPDGYIIGRKIVFFGRVLRFGAIAKTWHYRLFRTGMGRCEDRLYDQHFVSFGRVARINAFMLDHQDNSISDWTARHNRWSDMEVAEILRGGSEDTQAVVSANPNGSIIEKKRAKKKSYYRLPRFVRACSYFFYSYFFKLGFLDGKRGFIFYTLQSFWFRLLIDVKLYEADYLKQVSK